MEEAIRRAVHLVLLQALEAAEAAGGDVILVRSDVDDPPLVDVDLEPAESLADAAERVLGGHGISLDYA